MKKNDIERQQRLNRIIVPPDLPIIQAFGVMDRGGVGVLLLCDATRHLHGTLTDGDLRRAVMRSMPMNTPSIDVAGRTPLTAPAGISTDQALELMDSGRKFVINRLPLIDEQGRIVDFILRSDLVRGGSLDLQAVVMAGGFGNRLRPLTDDTPKPMLPMGGKPMLEHIVSRLRDAAIKNVRFTTHYLHDKIESHFGDGSDFGVNIEYVAEDKPLGTAGSLGLLDRPETTSLVINGDIMTGIDFEAMLVYHQEQQATITVGVRRYEFEVPYGVLEHDGDLVTGITEKPMLDYFVNAGVYLLEPENYDIIPAQMRWDMPDLITAAIDSGGTVVGFPITEYWFDIGKLEDYQQAKREYENGGLKNKL
ncbi:MAG: CBS domain-containing protein [Proteobacteria bacterium]|nr:CBS domain-containing protein [Pseudomonadota bacterium]